MGQTAGGLPWPEGTALVRDGDDAIRALAEAIDPKMAALIGGGNQILPDTVEVRNTPYEPTFTVNLARAANTVLLTAHFGINFVGVDGGENQFDAYVKWDGVEREHMVLKPRTTANQDSYRQYSIRVLVANQAAGNHTVLLGMFSGQGLIMHTKVLGIALEALGN